ncbi:MAG: alanine--glyoxylate aminotransferase family protein [Chloroflexi bacterium]|nr:alanine--glyoxylate aminotransferase family protein [Chloroflexota bacterium]
MNLRIPGPTPCPEPVLQAVGGQMINHRGPEAAELIRACTDGLKTAFKTKGDIVILTASGTGGLEAAVANTLSPGERCLVVSIGVFGERIADIAKTFGADPVRLDFPYGQSADPARVRETLKAEPRINTVFVTHNETSTGVTNDLAALSNVIKGEFGKTLVVDGISSIGSIPCPVDEWGIDLAISGSQKGWMTPPGLAFVGVSPKGWETIAKAKMPRYYFDLAKAKKSADKGETPWTPALSIMFGLRVGLDLLQKEGLDNVYRRHHELGDRTRRAVKGLGLELFADERHASNTVTAVKVPAGLEWKTLSGMLRKEHKTVLAGGQGPMTGKVFRIGHLGWVNAAEIDAAIAALKASLASLKSAAPAGARNA